jgi:hypothetical protein
VYDRRDVRSFADSNPSRTVVTSLSYSGTVLLRMSDKVSKIRASGRSWPTRLVKLSLSAGTCISDQSTSLLEEQTGACINRGHRRRKGGYQSKGACNSATHHVANGICMVRLHCACIGILGANGRASSRSIKNELGLKPQDVAQHIEWICLW